MGVTLYKCNRFNLLIEYTLWFLHREMYIYKITWQINESAQLLKFNEKKARERERENKEKTLKIAMIEAESVVQTCFAFQ